MVPSQGVVAQLGPNDKKPNKLRPFGSVTSAHRLLGDLLAQGQGVSPRLGFKAKQSMRVDGGKGGCGAQGRQPVALGAVGANVAVLHHK
ncbi:hypothetical protein FZEAL_5765, partial [Fusarium zealandicum]